MPHGPSQVVESPRPALDEVLVGWRLRVTYTRPDRVRFPCRFLDPPSAGSGPVGGILQAFPFAGGRVLRGGFAAGEPRHIPLGTLASPYPDSIRTV
jgi:hypothetical protein